MSNFKKMFGLAGAVMVFTGLAYGQATCAAPTANTSIIRAEGMTELVAPLTFVCTVPGGATAAAGSASVQVFLSPSLPVTSKLNTGSTTATEATLTVNGNAATAVSGTVSGSTVNFSGVTLPALAAAGTYTFTISNIRVNATSLSVGTGVPPNITETVFVSGSATSITPAALASTTVAFAQNGLGATRTFKTFTVTGGSAIFPLGTGSTAGVNNYVICSAVSPNASKVTFAPVAPATTVALTGNSLAAVVSVNENFAQAFKTLADENGSNGQGGPQSTTSATTATRIKLVFGAVPTGVTLYVPNGQIPSQNGSGLAKIQLTSSETGAFSAVTASTATSLAGLALAPVSGTAVFEVVTDDYTNLDRFDIPVFVVSTANSVTGSSTPLNVSVSFAPTGAATNIPNFSAGSSTTSTPLSAFSACTTSLLFPFVTNQLGFDTGIAIANTSTDPFGTNGATPQAGTCTLNFYGAGAPTPSNVTSPNIPTGTVFTQVLSNVAAGFQGYMIAQCTFQFAHGFAFVTDGVGANGGLSQGYLAGVIPDVNQTARAANPLSSAPAGSGETLGN